jgi:hypothetical protein
MPGSYLGIDMKNFKYSDSYVYLCGRKQIGLAVYVLLPNDQG